MWWKIIKILKIYNIFIAHDPVDKDHETKNKDSFEIIHIAPRNTPVLAKFKGFKFYMNESM